ncbi:hypothetical protein E1265_07005 [Streptomyces sp. 8K308]|nr:hypothetical protein E1265_07005 [Streptomyces sp. 8K308]
MPESNCERPPCTNCGGFHAVAITTGQRLPDHSRETVVVHCAAHHPDQPPTPCTDDTSGAPLRNTAEAR